MLHLAVTKRARQIQKLLKVRKIDRLTSMLTFVKTVELESFIAAAAPLGCCSGLMKPDTHLGENARQIEVSDDQTTPCLFR